jgi:hypothetical protein
MVRRALSHAADDGRGDGRIQGAKQTRTNRRRIVDIDSLLARSRLYLVVNS